METGGRFQLKRGGSQFSRVHNIQSNLAVSMPKIRCERPWLCELIQHVAALPDPLPRWAKKIWVEFLYHVQEEQNAFRLSSDSKGVVAQPLAVRACSGGG